MDSNNNNRSSSSFISSSPTSSNDIDQMEETPHRPAGGSYHRRAHSDFSSSFRLPNLDDLLLFDPSDLDSFPSPVLPRGTGTATATNSAIVPMPIDSDDSSGTRLSSGGPTAARFRSLSVDSDFFDGLGFGGEAGGGGKEAVGGKKGGGGHRHNNSMDGGSSFDADSVLDGLKKSITPDKLADLSLIDPKRAKRSSSFNFPNAHASPPIPNFPPSKPNPELPKTSTMDDKDLDDAALWAVIDSAAAASSHSKSRNSLAIQYPNHPKLFKTPRISYSGESDARSEGEVFEEPWAFQPPRKIARSAANDGNNSLAVVRTVQRTPTPLSPGIGRFSSPGVSYAPRDERDHNPVHPVQHSLSGMFPSVSLFKEYQDAAMAILEKTDYVKIHGSTYIKKSGWRKISFYFNLSFEIKDKSIEYDESRNVLRAEFVVRAYMQGGRFSDGWGSCDRREKRFNKPNHDIPSTAETRAKNKASSDLLGIGDYRPGANQDHPYA